jgi:glycosyltransferase involved in cell wall biosynthesis
MSKGKPVIGTKPGGHGDMIEHGVSGLLVPAGDVDALGAAIGQLLDDGAARAAMGEAARIQSQRFTESEVFPKFAQLYADAADGALA